MGTQKKGNTHSRFDHSEKGGFIGSAEACAPELGDEDRPRVEQRRVPRRREPSLQVLQPNVVGERR